VEEEWKKSEEEELEMALLANQEQQWKDECFEQEERR
jgi:hypothetical protein